jgi:hypothetical protein
MLKKGMFLLLLSSSAVSIVNGIEYSALSTPMAKHDEKMSITVAPQDKRIITMLYLHQDPDENAISLTSTITIADDTQEISTTNTMQPPDENESSLSAKDKTYIYAFNFLQSKILDALHTKLHHYTDTTLEKRSSELSLNKNGIELKRLGVDSDNLENIALQVVEDYNRSKKSIKSIQNKDITRGTTTAEWLGLIAFGGALAALGYKWFNAGK